MNKLKALNYVIVALFLFAYTVLDDIVPTFVDNAIAGIEALTMLIAAVKTLKST